ncbi:MAG: DoxX family membrane protein [Dokdonella sp.]
MPIADTVDNSAARSALGWTILRLALALLIAAHGWGRLIAGGVVPFGQWLDGVGFPAGFAIAVSITALEIIGTVLLALRRLVLAVALALSLLYAVGIVLVHAPAGWFVVGLGRNGAEYSVLLIVCLLCVGLQERRSSRPLVADRPHKDR